MNRRFIAVLIFAFVVASGASLLLYRLMSNKQTAKTAPSGVKVVVAAHNLELGQLLKEADVKVADWPGAVPPGATNSLQDVVGRGVTSQMFAEEPVLQTRLAPKGAGGGLAAMIPTGMRAVPVRVNEIVGVAGFVVPGTRVDVLISGSPPGPRGPELGSLTKTMLQNIEVLSAGQDFKKDAEGKPVLTQVVTLLVNPEQAEQLSLAANQTVIQLILRNPLDRDVAKTRGTAMGLLFSGAKMSMPGERSTELQAPPKPRAVRRAPRIEPTIIAARPEPKPAPFVMEIFQGAKRAETKFSGAEEKP